MTWEIGDREQFRSRNSSLSRIEGKKTMGFEAAENFSWNLPDAIFYPTGGRARFVACMLAPSGLKGTGLHVDAYIACTLEFNLEFVVCGVFNPVCRSKGDISPGPRQTAAPFFNPSRPPTALTYLRLPS